MITRLFQSTPQHPLADPKELRDIVAALPADDPSRLVSEVGDWFASLEQLDSLREDSLWQACTALDAAARPALRRLTRDFLLAPPRRDAAHRLVSLLRDEYCGRLAALYARVLRAAQRRDKLGDMLRQDAPRIAEQLLATLNLQFKWAAYWHSPPPTGFWRRLGDAYLTAVALGIDELPVRSDAHDGAPRTLARHYLQTVLLAASSPDSLLPAEVELADRAIAHFLPHFAMAPSNLPGMLYWVDAALDQPPLRLATLPSPSSSVRLISPGQLHKEVERLLLEVQKGVIPETFTVCGLSSKRQASRVLRHLARYWAPYPPMRKHQRHAMTIEINVVQGFAACADRFDPRTAAADPACAVWNAHDVSQGGLGVRVRAQAASELRVGNLLGLQSAPGERWMAGVIRRLTRNHDGSADAGIEILARQIRLIEVHARTASGTLAPESIRALILDRISGSGELRLLLPGNTYDSGETLEAARLRLSPVNCEDSAEFDLATYRARVEE